MNVVLDDGACPSTAVTALDLAGVLGERDQFDEAEHMYRRALSAFEAAYGTDHAETERAQASLEELLRLRATSSKATFTV